MYNEIAGQSENPYKRRVLCGVIFTVSCPYMEVVALDSEVTLFFP